MSSKALLQALFLPTFYSYHGAFLAIWLYSASIFYCLLIFIAQYSAWLLSYARNYLHIYARLLIFSVSIPRHIVPGFLPDFYNSFHICARFFISSTLVPCHIMPGFSVIFPESLAHMCQTLYFLQLNSMLYGARNLIIFISIPRYIVPRFLIFFIDTSPQLRHLSYITYLILYPDRPERRSLQ